MWLHPVSVKENVQTYISPKLCLTPEIKSKYFRTGECVGIGQTTVSFRNHKYNLGTVNKRLLGVGQGGAKLVLLDPRVGKKSLRN